jgi:hypothetical protein
MSRALALLVVLFLALSPVTAQQPKAPPIGVEGRPPIAVEGKPDAKPPPPASDARASDFRVEEVAALADVPVSQLKLKTIALADRPAQNLLDPGTGFMRYEDWARARPIEQQFLTLYPGYTEPNTDIVVDGVKKHYKEKLHVYVASARFALSRPPGSIDLARLITLPFVEQIDPAIKNTLINAGEVTSKPEPKTITNENPRRRWCEGRPTVICLRSHYRLEGRFPVGIALANKLRDSEKKAIPDFLEFESELTLRSPAEVEQSGLTKLTALDTPSIGAIEQSIFYVNQVIQFGKLLAVFQQFPNDPNRTVVTVYMALAIESNVLNKQKEFAAVPVLRNLVPAQVLAGKSSFNTGNSLSAGFPVYARNSVKAIAGILDRGG